jgi:hypothetical protein
MEDPATWDAVTASLAAADLTRPPEAWRFLAFSGLVAEGRAPDAFVAWVDGERARRAPPGPSLAWRAAAWLADAGCLLPAAREPDPGGARAAARWHAFRGAP